MAVSIDMLQIYRIASEAEKSLIPRNRNILYEVFFRKVTFFKSNGFINYDFDLLYLISES